jgi:hypothetical protein
MSDLLTLNDIAVIEGEKETDEDGYYTAIQKAINGYEAWKMQGSMGRAMMAAIKAGRCMLGRHSCADYYGNRIPGRDEVAPGTKGHRSFVAEQSGEEWAARFEAIQ